MAAAAQEEILRSVSINFRQSKAYLDPNYKMNKVALEEIEELAALNDNPDSTYILKEVMVVGGASPEGSVKYNEYISRKRADRIIQYLETKTDLPDSLFSYKFLGRDWNGLRLLVEQDSLVPYREDVLSLLDHIIDNTRSGESESAGNLTKLKRLHGSKPYIYMYNHLFPQLRASRVQLKFISKPVITPHTVEIEETPIPSEPESIPEIEETIETIEEEPTVVEQPVKPFYMDIHTNLLYDALAVPNIGMQFYLGKNLSINAEWMYGWWKSDPPHRYWRIYGGELALRWWLGKAAHTKPLTGHHIGIYGGALTYDFEWGARGYMGGKPGGSLWDRCNYVGGVEYGFSLPVAKRLNVDFTVGIGYFGGKFLEYLPEDDCYVWQCTKRRNWFGPTKAQISLVWLLGRDNVNDRRKTKKGGGK